MTARRIPVPLAVAAASVPMFMATLDNLVVTTALPAIHDALGASLEQLQWVTNAYTLSFAALMLFAVGLGDRYGRRTMFVSGIVIFAAASAAGGLSTTIGALILARAVQGIGAAAVLPLSLTLLAGAVPARTRPLAIGIWGGISGLGIALGPVVGGALVTNLSWNAIFWINVPIAVLAVPLALFALSNSVGVRVRADVLGVILASTGIVSTIYGVVRGNDAGWASAEVLTTLIAGVALLVVFVLWESRTASPLLPLRLFRIRSFSAANVIGLVFSFGTFGSVFLLTQFLQVVQGHTALAAGLMTMPWTLAPMFLAPIAGFVAPRVGTRTLIVAGLTFLALGIGWLGITLTSDVTYLTQLPGYLAAGIGMGLVFAPLSTAVLQDTADIDHARASGTNSTIREIGIALGVAVLTAVFTGAGGTLTPTGFTAAAQPAIIVGAAVVATAGLLALLLPGRTTPAAERALPTSTVAEGIGTAPTMAAA